MTQLRAVAIAAFFLGIGMAGEPLTPLRALLAGGLMLLIVTPLEERSSPLVIFLVATVGVLLTCYLQRSDIYDPERTAVVAIGLGGLAASSFGRRTAPAATAVLGTLIGVGLFFLSPE